MPRAPPWRRPRVPRSPPFPSPSHCGGASPPAWAPAPRPWPSACIRPPAGRP